MEGQVAQRRRRRLQRGPGGGERAGGAGGEQVLQQPYECTHGVWRELQRERHGNATRSLLSEPRVALVLRRMQLAIVRCVDHTVQPRPSSRTSAAVRSAGGVPGGARSNSVSRGAAAPQCGDEGAGAAGEGRREFGRWCGCPAPTDDEGALVKLRGLPPAGVAARRGRGRAATRADHRRVRPRGARAGRRRARRRLAAAAEATLVAGSDATAAAAETLVEEDVVERARR